MKRPCADTMRTIRHHWILYPCDPKDAKQTSVMATESGVLNIFWHEFIFVIDVIPRVNNMMRFMRSSTNVRKIDTLHSMANLNLRYWRAHARVQVCKRQCHVHHLIYHSRQWFRASWRQNYIISRSMSATKLLPRLRRIIITTTSKPATEKA